MKTTDVLKREHETIERVLRVLCLAVAAVRGGRPLPAGFQPWVVSFLREFADSHHHGKEEQLLFPLLERRGVPRDGGPISCMLHEHDLGRQLVQVMAQPLEVHAAGAQRFAAAADEYVALLRQHIFKENNVLFTMADRVCSPADDLEMLSAFHRQDQVAATQPTLDQEIRYWEAAVADLLKTPTPCSP